MDYLSCNWDNAKFLIISANVFGSFVYYSHLLPLIFSVIIGFFILLKDKKSLINQALFFILAVFSFWVYADLVLWASEKPELIMVFWALEVLIEPLIYAGCLYFVYVFINKKDINFKNKIIIALMLLPMVLLAPTSLGVSAFDHTNCDRAAIEGALVQYGYIIEFIFIIWMLIFSVAKYIKADKEFRKQILLIVSGISLFLLAFSWGNLVQSITADWTLGQYGLFGAPVFVAFLAYIIVKFNAFNVKMFGTQALVSALGFLVLSILFIRRIENVRVVVVFTFILVTTLGYFLVRSVKKEIQAREEMAKLANDLKRTNLKLDDANLNLKEKNSALKGLAESLEVSNNQLDTANVSLKELDKQKSEFLDIASHQLRTPLSAMIGLLSMQADGDFEKLSDKEQKEQQNNMLISADRLKNIVADLMDAMEAEMGLSLKLVPVNVEKLVAEAINTLKPNYDKKELYLKYIAPEKLTPYFPADPTLLLQVFMNLIDDACQYTEKGGATVRVYGSGENVVFEIKDTGIGVSEEEERNLFQKFQRAKRAMLVHPDGSGLGLFIARKIVKAHNGAITLESAGVDKGTTFTVTIPAIPVIPETKALEILAKK
ncbi:MAG: hypothetical protein A3J93_00865 [Candidatus Magasanikbacteria bacterium RIFOXYC2_FULL_42_28]|uniref:histidine kinase n=1 Tax=Candidatus Magasanikbacteria bacterium RIFOXYC2_FULL_42_28 TaxID=1798704 RepID=A0A1F6NXM1_9BACT|nr:MAG: hypothetical protein A3J93_00865 [Candidatus Magasanikbacteria bacterium RIFOXYC2_FULL_42_28]